MGNTNSDFKEIKIICTEDCGNAPKKQLLKDLNIAFAKNDLDLINELITKDVIWNIIGDKKIQGKDNFIIEKKEQMKNRSVKEMHISNILTHGKAGSVNGVLLLEGKKNIAYCDVYNFNSSRNHTKIKEITSYLIAIS